MKYHPTKHVHIYFDVYNTCCVNPCPLYNSIDRLSPPISIALVTSDDKKDIDESPPLGTIVTFPISCKNAVERTLMAEIKRVF